MFNVNLVTSKMKLQVASQDGSVLVVTTPGAGSPTPRLGASNVVQWRQMASASPVTRGVGLMNMCEHMCLRHTVTHGETRPCSDRFSEYCNGGTNVTSDENDCNQMVFL